MTYNKKTIEDIDIKGKKVLVRCDFNVPVKDGVITSEKRIVEALPTIKYLVANGAKVILCSHMGKPHNIFEESFKLNKKELAAIALFPKTSRKRQRQLQKRKLSKTRANSPLKSLPTSSTSFSAVS